MMDAPPKKRPWFQLHLSTCVVLMVVAGVLGWANTAEKEQIPPPPIKLGYQWPGIGAQERGWPAVAQRQAWNGTSAPETGSGPPLDIFHWRGSRLGWDLAGLVINALTALAILALATIACEYMIRLRACKRQDPAP